MKRNGVGVGESLDSRVWSGVGSRV